MPPPANCSVHISGESEAQRACLDVAWPPQLILSGLLFLSSLLPKILLLLSEVTGHYASDRITSCIKKEANLSSKNRCRRPQKRSAENAG